MLLDEFSLPRLTSPESAAAFRLSNNARKYAMRRFFLYFGVVAYGLHAFLDFWVGGDETQVLLILRMGSASLLLCCAVFFHLCPHSRISHSQVIVIYLGIGSLGVIAGSTVVDGVLAALWPTGLIVVLAFGGSILSPPFRWTLGLTTLTYLTFWATVPFFALPPIAVPVHLFLMTIGFFAICIGSLTRERFERLQWLADAEILKARDEAIEARAAQGRLIASMSHELRTPLNAVIGFSDFMLHKPYGSFDPRYIDYIESIKTAGQVELRLVNDLLDTMRLDRGKVDWTDEQFNMQRGIESAVTMCGPQASTSNVALNLIDGSDSVGAIGDPVRFGQALTNLITNAIKFTPAGGNVTVTQSLLKTGDFRVTIADTGIGMRAEDLARVREPFEQADDGRGSIARGGLGLGLNIAIGYIEMMGGRLDIESEFGVGTICTILVPGERLTISANDADAA